MIKSALTAVSFLSKLPLGGGIYDEYKKSVAHFPLVGYIAFGVYLFVYWLCENLLKDHIVSVAAATASAYYFFNLMHFDGLLDSVDGLFSQKPAVEMLKIMKQGNIGPTAVFWGFIYLALKIYFLLKINVMAVVIMFVVGKWGMGFCCAIGKPVRTDGLGVSFLNSGRIFWVLSLSYIFFLFIFFDPLIMITILIGVLLADKIIVYKISRKIGGLTGDTLGLINEINELLVLLTVYVFSIKGFECLR